MLCVDINDKNSTKRLVDGLKLLLQNKKVVILCIGCEKVMGDSLGPMIGTALTDKLNRDVIVYGMLDSNINAHNLLMATKMIKTLHKDRLLVAIDAGLGTMGEVGTIQIYTHGLYPGSATNKNLPCVGDISIVGIVNQKISTLGLPMLYTAKYTLVKNMVHIISDSLLQILNQ